MLDNNKIKYSCALEGEEFRTKATKEYFQLGFKFGFQFVVDFQIKMGQTQRSSLKDMINKNKSTLAFHYLQNKIMFDIIQKFNVLLYCKQGSNNINKQFVDSGVQREHGSLMQPHESGVQPHDITLDESYGMIVHINFMMVIYDFVLINFVLWMTERVIHEDLLPEEEHNGGHSNSVN